MQRPAAYFRVFRNRLFTRLYLAETISLAGDAFTWVGLALLAFQFGGNRSGSILSTALTLRVTAFVLVAPLAGILADRYDRKKIMYSAHVARMIIVGFLPFITKVWEIYALVFLLNIFNAVFTPAYKAAIPQTIARKEDYASAISLSSGTYQLLAVLGPGMAGALAALIGAREIFFIDAASFFIAGILIFTLPGYLIVSQQANWERPEGVNWSNIKKGTIALFNSKPLRFALFINLASAIAGAQVLVNTIGFIKGSLHLGDVQYGWVMSAFGIGATIAAFSIGVLGKRIPLVRLILLGGILTSLALIPGNFVQPLPLMGLWLLVGLGQGYVEIPAETLIAEGIPLQDQGRVYGAHFAWSHLWWAIAYPVAGFTSIHFENRYFLYGGLLALLFVIIFYAFFSYRRADVEKSGRAIREGSR